jgi:hypothetical protein
VLFDEVFLLSRALPIAAAPGSVEREDSGCAVAPASRRVRTHGAYTALLGLLGVCTLRRRALRSRPGTR